MKSFLRVALHTVLLPALTFALGMFIYQSPKVQAFVKRIPGLG